MDQSNPSHFTTMQVRGGKTIGFDFHLARLDGATRELFGVGLEGERVRGYIRHALARELTGAGIAWRRERIRLADVASFDGAFITNSRGIAPVARIDDLELPVDAPLLDTVLRLISAAPCDPI